MRKGGGKPNGLPPPSFFLFDSVLDHVDIEMVVGHLDTVGAGSSATCGKAATASKIAVQTVSVGAS